MSDSSLVLSLPYIQPAQAQKHVTHNEAIRALDMMVQPTVQEMGRTTPPETPALGARYGVGPGASDAWAGQDGAIALWEITGWRFLAPQAGWSTRATDTLIEWVFDGSAWVVPQTTASQLGINATADATNRLSVSAPATLLTHEGAGHQVKINKASAADTASLLYQTNWSGRAEMGTTGSDDFAIKVSADGSTWFTGLEVASDTGVVRFPSGARLTRHTEITGRWTSYTDQRWVTVERAVGLSAGTHTSGGGTGAEPSLDWSDMGLFLPQGAVLEDLQGRLRANGTGAGQLTSTSLRLYFQYGPETPGASGWATNAETTRDTLFAADDIALSVGWQSLLASLSGYTTPRDGTLLIYLKPGGTYTQNTAILTSFALRYTL